MHEIDLRFEAKRAASETMLGQSVIWSEDQTQTIQWQDLLGPLKERYQNGKAWGKGRGWTLSWSTPTCAWMMPQIIHVRDRGPDMQVFAGRLQWCHRPRRVSRDCSLARPH